MTLDVNDMDAEANAFAMELLMPFDWIVRDSAGVDLCEEEAVAKLAKRYRVPTTTMAIRIGEVRMELALSDGAGHGTASTSDQGEG